VAASHSLRLPTVARRRHPEHLEDAAELSPIEVTTADRLDPRATMNAPAPIHDAPEELLRWAVDHDPGAVLSPEQARAQLEGRARRRALVAARIDARRKGRPVPDARDFLGGDHYPAV